MQKNKLKNSNHFDLPLAWEKSKRVIFSSIIIPFVLLMSMAMSGCIPALHSAAWKGDAKTVGELLDKGANVNEVSSDSDTPLLYSTGNDNVDTMRLLLDRGADINAQGFWGFSPLAESAVKGNMDAVRLLIDRGADIDSALAQLEYYEARSGSGGAWNKEVKPAIKLIERLAKKRETGGQPVMVREKGWIGVEVRNYTNEAVSGAEVVSTVKDAPAEIAGILPGDVIVGLNETKIVGMNFVNKVQSLVPGTMAKIKIIRVGIEKELLLRVASNNSNQAASNVTGKPEQSADISSVKSDVDELPAIKAKQNKNAYAIVIGIENYRQKLPKADFATQDAKLVADYLTKVMGYPEENIVALSNEHATKSDFEKYFERWLPNNVEAGSSVFVYYSGHGAPNPKTSDAYLVPYDGDPSFITETGYSLKRMYAALGKLSAKEIVVALDSCFSGAGGRSVIAKGARPLVMNLQSDVVLSKNMTVLSASSGEQTSSTYDEKGHGLFTYFMLKGIKNEDVIKPDGSIRMDDLFGYIKPQVERIARKQYNNQQTPQLMGTKKD